MAQGSDLLRRAACLAAGALAVHQLRYQAGYGADSAAAAAEHGHAYHPWAAAAALALLVAAFCALALSLVAEFRRLYAKPLRGTPRGGFTRSWLASSATLAAIYSIQELVEGVVAHGHPAGLAALTSQRGWTAYLLALAIGALIALALRGARGALVLAGRSSRPLGLAAGRFAGLWRPAAALALARPGVLAAKLAGRAPPASR